MEAISQQLELFFVPLTLILCILLRSFSVGLLSFSIGLWIELKDEVEVCDRCCDDGE